MMWGFGMGFGMWLLPAVLVALVVWLIVPDRKRSHADDALDILRNRLARGEVAEEEFLRLKALLK